jgi:hypothetical protein
MSDAIIKYERTEQGVRIVPVYREETKDYFVDLSKIAPWLVEVDGVEVQTAALKIGTLFDLLGISQTQSLLDTGVLDMTDSLDPNIALESIFVEAKYPDGTSKVQRYELVHDTGDQQVGTQFTFLAQNHRQLEVSYHTNTLLSPSANSAMDLHVAGIINLQLGHCELVASGVQAGTEPDVEHEVIGYTLKAFRTNYNRRPVEIPAVWPEGEAVLKQPEAEQEAAPETPEVISAFSGKEYMPGYFNQGKHITSHEVEGAASNLTITVGDEPAVPGNANHRYDITGFDTDSNASEYEGSFARALSILFQNGPIPSHGNNGVTLEALLAVAAHRLEGFQAGPFASQDNEDALSHIKMALEALQRRTRNRIAREVEGTYQA